MRRARWWPMSVLQRKIVKWPTSWQSQVCCTDSRMFCVNILLMKSYHHQSPFHHTGWQNYHLYWRLWQHWYHLWNRDRGMWMGEPGARWLASILTWSRQPPSMTDPCPPASNRLCTSTRTCYSLLLMLSRIVPRVETITKMIFLYTVVLLRVEYFVFCFCLITLSKQCQI